MYQAEGLRTNQILQKSAIFANAPGANGKVCCIFRVLNLKLTGDKY